MPFSNRTPSATRSSLNGTVGFFLFLAVSIVLINIEFVRSLYDRGQQHAAAADAPLLRRVLNKKHQPHQNGLRSHYQPTLTPRQRMEAPKAKLDFLIAGFPKCGTTSLLYALRAHSETDIDSRETCGYSNPAFSGRDGVELIDVAVLKLPTSHYMMKNPPTNVKRGIKCPGGISSAHALERVQRHSPNTKLIIGIRHPVFFLQSYFNYRVTEIYDRNSTESIPPIETLLGNSGWKGINTDRARFELYLMQLGKTDLSMEELDQISHRNQIGVKPNNFKIFLYSLEQMEDRNKKRATSFRRELQSFLGLEAPFPPFGKENINHFVGHNAHNETIDICDDKYKELRSLLVAQGKVTAKWIRTAFVRSGDVTIANPDHFLTSIRSWEKDPCLPKLKGPQQQAMLAIA